MNGGCYILYLVFYIFWMWMKCVICVFVSELGYRKKVRKNAV